MAFLRSTWCYGLSKIFTTKNKFFKTMWTVFVTISSICCVFFIYSSIRNFMQFSVVTQTKLVFNSTMEFPQIVICMDKNQVASNKDIVECQFDREDCRKEFLPHPVRVILIIMYFFSLNI